MKFILARDVLSICRHMRIWVSSKSRFLATKICSIALYQFMEMDCTSSFVSVDPMNSTDQPKKEPKREVKPQIRSARAGLIFPVGKVHRSLKQSCGGKRVVAPAAVYCSAVLEYLTAEVMELAGSACKEFKMKTITPRHMQLAIRGDDELSSFIKGQIAGGGVVPHHLKESLLLLLRCQIFMSQRARAIDLYRRLIGYSKQLKLTDRDYFCERIRQSYVASINKPESVVEKYIKKGEELLQKRRFI
uniref:Histone H2A n=1 Tax=Ditylenchus dipsaci TaxID=166011 RepID=A0A915CTF8_9BILA